MRGFLLSRFLYHLVVTGNLWIAASVVSLLLFLEKLYGAEPDTDYRFFLFGATVLVYDFHRTDLGRPLRSDDLYRLASVVCALLLLGLTWRQFNDYFILLLPPLVITASYLLYRKTGILSVRRYWLLKPVSVGVCWAWMSHIPFIAAGNRTAWGFGAVFAFITGLTWVFDWKDRETDQAGTTLAHRYTLASLKLQALCWLTLGVVAMTAGYIAGKAGWQATAAWASAALLTGVLIARLREDADRTFFHLILDGSILLPYLLLLLYTWC